MFKIKMVDSEYGAIPEIVENDRGDWEVKVDDNTGTATLVGFGGENTITVHLSTMQGNVFDVALVHQGCDDYLKVAHSSLKPKERYCLNELTDHVDSLLAQVINYPEKL